MTSNGTDSRSNEVGPCVVCPRVYDAQEIQPLRKSYVLTRLTPWAGLVFLALLAFMPAQAEAKKLVISEAFEITGKIQRPQAMYILQRSKLNLKGLQLRRSLIPKLLESMRKPPL
jgi:hypothetical protein